MGAILGMILPGLFKIGSQFLSNDADKSKYAFQVLQMTNDLSLKLLDTKTYPWVDAVVKLAYASNQVIKGLFRPIGSAAMMAFGIYAKMHNLHLPPEVEAVVFGAFPAWGVSRHLEKAAAAKINKVDTGETSW